MDRTIRWAALAAIMLASPAAAQDSGSDLSAAILQAIRLPGAARDARALGVPDQDVRNILRMARDRSVRAGDITALLNVENDAIRQHGPIDNFGAFVQQKLDSGLRGKDLAAAIHVEHGARGKGGGSSMGGGKSGDMHGKSVSPGKSGDAGKPDTSPGKSGEAGKKGGSR